MYAIDFDWPIHLLGESRYEANCSLVVAHGYIAHMEVGEGCEHDCMEVGGRSCRSSCRRAETLPYTSVNVHSTPSNGSF